MVEKVPNLEGENQEDVEDHTHQRLTQNFGSKQAEDKEEHKDDVEEGIPNAKCQWESADQATRSNPVVEQSPNKLQKRGNPKIENPPSSGQMPAKQEDAQRERVLAVAHPKPQSSKSPRLKASGSKSRKKALWLCARGQLEAVNLSA